MEPDQTESLRPGKRPAPGRRCFSSPAVEAHLESISREINDSQLRQMFQLCFPNTLGIFIDLAMRVFRLAGRYHDSASCYTRRFSARYVCNHGRYSCKMSD